uniref:Tectonin beta-propeller repeat containing 1b n=1 Tax=Eptatretus burgeri TaxID=7764 RepID=A0A8C4N964_EPTBU
MGTRMLVVLKPLFCDIAVGGWQMWDNDSGTLSVWAVTVDGKIKFRLGVTRDTPEGIGWQTVETPSQVLQLSCSPSSLVWAVLWEGKLLMRLQVNRSCPQGHGWFEVSPPEHEFGVVQVAVGTRVIWTVTSDGKVWFRTSVTPSCPAGVGWVEMPVHLIMLSVAPDDQVWAIERRRRSLYIREGIDSSELGGRSWKLVALTPDRKVDGQKMVGAQEQDGGTENVEEQLTCMRVNDKPRDGESGGHDSESEDSEKLMMAKAEGWNKMDKELESKDGFGASDIMREACKKVGIWDAEAYNWEATAQKERPLDETSSLCSSVGEEGADSFECDAPIWTWVSAGACLVDWANLPSWLASSRDGVNMKMARETARQTASESPWHRNIARQLVELAQKERQGFEHYPQATDQQEMWVRKGFLQWWRDWAPHKWMPVEVELEQVLGHEGRKEALLLIYYRMGSTPKYLHVFVSDVTIFVPILSPTRHTFAVYTPESTRARWPVRLATRTEEELRDWLAVLTLAVCQTRGLSKQPSASAFWSVTCCGDVFVCDPPSHQEELQKPPPADELFWRQVGGHLRLVETGAGGVVWGLGYDNTPWVYTGGYGGGFLQGLVGSLDDMGTQTDHMQVDLYENQRWNPITGYTARGLLTDRYMWSDKSGLNERNKDSVRPPSPLWCWDSNWSVDFAVPGGTDKEGWQYASDFPASYHGSKTIKDFVRRRRWERYCKLVTSGPWREVHRSPLLDISIMPDPSHESQHRSDSDTIALWAISVNGDVLYRQGVTRGNTIGESWHHVPTDQPFMSISVGRKGQVWAVSSNGAAFLRQGLSANCFTGTHWELVCAPARQQFCQVSVGDCTVCCVDKQGNLWLREGLEKGGTSGTGWKLISDNIRKVSVGPVDQIWAIADHVQGTMSLSRGTVAHRIGVGPASPAGVRWEYGIGGGWDHISVRGFFPRPPQVDEVQSADNLDLLPSPDSGSNTRSTESFSAIAC